MLYFHNSETSRLPADKDQTLTVKGGDRGEFKCNEKGLAFDEHNGLFVMQSADGNFLIGMKGGPSFVFEPDGNFNVSSNPGANLATYNAPPGKDIAYVPQAANALK